MSLYFFGAINFFVVAACAFVIDGPDIPDMKETIIFDSESKRTHCTAIHAV
jgi:hypothetical protein